MCGKERKKDAGWRSEDGERERPKKKERGGRKQEQNKNAYIWKIPWRDPHFRPKNALFFLLGAKKIFIEVILKRVPQIKIQYMV